jgi:hypothetical protein
MTIAGGNFNRYQSGGGRPVDEIGYTTPGIEYSESERPAVGFLPAPYLPVLRFDAHKRSNIVLSAGTPVGLDNYGNLVPAGIPGGHTFTYTALDFTSDLTQTLMASTGAAVTGAGDVVMHASLVSGYAFVKPIGVVSFNVFAHEGGVTSGTWPVYTAQYDNPIYYNTHNTMAQDLVPVTCDYVLNIPYISGKNLLASTTKIFDDASLSVPVLSYAAKSYPFAHDELVLDNWSPGTAILGSGIKIVFVSPDCGTTSSGTCTSGAIYGSASAMQFSPPGNAVNASLVNITRPGYNIIYGADTSKYIVTYTEPPTLATAVSFVGRGFTLGSLLFTLADPIRPGDFVATRWGKFVRYNPYRHEPGDIIGQVLRVDNNPMKKDYLDRVKTAYERSSTVSHRMAGSATRGVPYLLHLVTDGALVLYETKKTTLAGTTGLGTISTYPGMAMIVVNMLR